MTYEEAKEMLDTAIEVARDEMAVALFMAYKAVEKQIPKKPLFVPYEESRRRTFKCPNCGSYELRRHCDDCGQLLKWSNE